MQSPAARKGTGRPRRAVRILGPPGRPGLVGRAALGLVTGQDRTVPVDWKVARSAVRVGGGAAHGAHWRVHVRLAGRRVEEPAAGVWVWMGNR